MSIQVIHPGLLLSVQDFGVTASEYGVVVGGAMDSFSVRWRMCWWATEGAAVCEITFGARELRFERER